MNDTPFLAYHSRKGIDFNFTNNERISKSGFAVNGKVVNGYFDGKGITVNINSQKSLNAVVGHEITHALEGTELYNELQKSVEKYAKHKGVYDSMWKSIQELYSGKTEEYQRKELTADLIGDYLFTDSQFVENLSAEKPNLFKRLYNKIKYFLKMATPGSKEAKQFEKVKRSFDKAYKNSTKTKTSGIQYSVSENAYQKALENNDTETMQKMVEETAKENGYEIFGYHGTHKGGFTEFNAKYSEDGASIFIAKNKETAQTYTRDYSGEDIDLNSNKEQDGVYHVAVKMQNPYIVDAKGKNWNQLTNEDIESRFKIQVKAVKEGIGYKYVLDVVEEKVTDQGRFYKAVSEKHLIKNQEFDSITEVRDALPNNMARSLKRSIAWDLMKKDSNAFETMNATHKDTYNLMSDWIDINKNGERVGLHTTNAWAEYAKENGHDGVIIKDVYDIGKQSRNAELERGDIYIAFDGEQIKSLNPVTYDNDGNVIPLSERFNSEEKDIRYSLSEGGKKKIPKGYVQLSKQEDFLVDYHVPKEFRSAIIEENDIVSESECEIVRHEIFKNVVKARREGRNLRFKGMVFSANHVFYYNNFSQTGFRVTNIVEIEEHNNSRIEGVYDDSINRRYGNRLGSGIEGIGASERGGHWRGSHDENGTARTGNVGLSQNRETNGRSSDLREDGRNYGAPVENNIAKINTEASSEDGVFFDTPIPTRNRIADDSEYTSKAYGKQVFGEDLRVAPVQESKNSLGGEYSPKGNYNVYGRDIGIAPIDIAPTTENIAQDNIAPMEAMEETKNSADSEKNTTIVEQLKDNSDMLNQMDIVAKMTIPKDMRTWSRKDIVDWTMNRLESTGYKVLREGVGNIFFGRKQIKKSMAYMSMEDMETYVHTLMPEVLKKGIEIESRDNHKGREYGTRTFAAPVEVNGIRGNMAVVVKKTTDNFYKVHRLVTPDGKVFEFEKKNKTALPNDGGVADNSSLATSTSTASNNIIADIAENTTEKSAENSEKDLDDITSVAGVEASTTDDIAPVESVTEENAAPVYEAENIEGVVGDEVAPTKNVHKKERKWVGTSTQSEVVDGKIKSEDLDQDVINYQPIPNKKTLGNANARLDSLGVE